MQQSPAIVLIPAYNPDSKLTTLIRELKGRFAGIVVVNDGSATGLDVFEELRAQSIPVIVHETNRGKGAALKTGFKWILENLPAAPAVVTADADGQHTPADIAKVAEAALSHPKALTLGVRAFSGKVPFRSRFGNWWTRQIFFLMTRLKIADTQTGLRGIPRALFQRMLTLQGDRYEYEMRMLADAKHHEEYPVQIPIETVYIEENASSHFNPLKDSIRIYGALVKFCISSVGSFFIDNAVFSLALFAFARSTDWKRATNVLVSIIIARAVSATANYIFNRKLVFKSKVAKSASFLRYWTLVLCIMAAGYALTASISRLADAQGFWITLIKIAVETALFFCSYNIQKKWIFKAS